MESLCKNRGYSKIVLYGFNEISTCLIYELENTEVQIVHLIDKNTMRLSFNFPISRLEDYLDYNGVDAMIVCVSTDFDAIKNELKDDVPVPIITFEELIYEL